MKPHQKLKVPNRSGFSLVETLVAAAIAAMVVSASISMVGAIATNRAAIEKDGNVLLGEDIPELIGIPPIQVGDSDYVDPDDVNYIPPWDRIIPFAPSIALSRDMEILRSELVEDVSHAAAVFCVGRNSNDSFRNVTISYPFESDARQLAEPGRFEELLNNEVRRTRDDPAVGDIFVPYRGAAPALAAAGGSPQPFTNYSIYIIGNQASSSSTETNILRVLSIYEVDFVSDTTPEGTYVYIKQWVQKGTNTVLEISNSVEVFYPKGEGDQSFYPPFVQFERADRIKNVEAPDYDANSNIFKKAENKPFYFVWLPDPAAPNLEAVGLPSGDLTGIQRKYADVSARTPYFFVIPMFPAL